MFSIHPFPGTPPNPLEGIFMLDEETVSAMGDAELSAALALLRSETDRRERERARFEKAELSKRNKSDPRCPECKARRMRDGRRRDGVRSYRCPKCGRRYSDASNTSLSSSKLTPAKIRAILTLITLDGPDWVVAEIAEGNVKTAQYWVDRCLDAAGEWSTASRLSGHVWIDEMRFAPIRASGFVDGVWTTYAGRIAKDAYMEAAFDSSGRGFCHLFAEKLGTPGSAMVSECLSGRIEPGSLLTHDGASCHDRAVRELSLGDDWVKFVAGDAEYERKMKLMSNCCSYLRHCFESHNGIKFSKLEAYGNFFMYRWSQIRKHGLRATIEFLFNRVCGTAKSQISESLF